MRRARAVMTRFTLVLGAGSLVVVCLVGTWLAFRPPIQELPPSDTIDNHMGFGWWEWTLNYRTATPLDAWYFPVAHELETAGWTRREEASAERHLPLVGPVIYTRMTAFGFVVVWERVELFSDLHGARVGMRRWLAIYSKEQSS